MKLKCEFCGSNIDTLKQNECPACGASFGDNKEYQQYLKYKSQFDQEMADLEIKEKQEHLEKQNLENERLKRDIRYENEKRKMAKALKTGCLITFIVFFSVIVIISAIVGVAVKMQNNSDTIKTTETYVEQYHKLEVGDIANMQYYDFELAEWDYYTPNSYAIRKGEKYIKLKFEITNTHNDRIVRNQAISCYDKNGSSCSRQYSLSSDDNAVEIKQQYIEPGKTYTAWCFFIVPENETQLTVNYGKYIEITVNLTEVADETS